ncbi:MAG: DUF998 domain-containing protein [Nitrososphaerota archaeon]|nr:DUF998 domain-containing protein [Nitrososphaerota archaeon]
MTRRAYPNAYVSTDEPARGSLARQALGVVAMAGIGYLGVVILVLSFATAEYNPVTQYASDYGVGAFAWAMDSGFLLAGIGFCSLALMALLSGAARGARAGAALLLPAGLALVLSAFFATDVEGAAPTFHGTVHNVAGVVFFVIAPLGLLLVNRGIGRERFRIILLALALTVVALSLNGALALNVTGLVERMLVLVVFSSAVLTAKSLYVGR